MDLLHKDITDKIIEAFYKVYNELGYGFLEKVYENAMLIELRAMGLNCESQKPITVHYLAHRVGDYNSDITVNECVIVELKTKEFLLEDNEFQLINYVKATDVEVGLLLNFGKKPQFKRKIFTNDKKYR